MLWRLSGWKTAQGRELKMLSYSQEAVTEQDEEEKTADAADTPEPALMAEASSHPCPSANADTDMRREQEEGAKAVWIAKYKKKKSTGLGTSITSAASWLDEILSGDFDKLTSSLFPLPTMYPIPRAPEGFSFSCQTS